MPNAQKLAELNELIELRCGEVAGMMADWHSDRAVTLVVGNDTGYVWKMRFNLGDSGRWTMIPLREAQY